MGGGGGRGGRERAGRGGRPSEGLAHGLGEEEGLREATEHEEPLLAQVPLACPRRLDHRQLPAAVKHRAVKKTEIAATGGQRLAVKTGPFSPDSTLTSCGGQHLYARSW